jgi:hypothetical protein
VYLIEIKAETFTKIARSLRDANVRFGSEADIEGLSLDVRFTPESGHRCPLYSKYQ